MGFNIQEYELASKDNYSNAAGYFCEFIINKDKKTACESARDVRKSGSTENITSDTALGKGVACIKGLPVYSPPVYLLTNKDKRTQNRMICKARKEAKMKDDVPPADAVKDNLATDMQAPMGGTPDAQKSNTAMYIGIGVGVLAIGIVAIILIRRK